MKNKTLSLPAVVLILTLCFICDDSWGYIEPSSGYILWQILFGLLAGFMFFAKRIWGFCKGLTDKARTQDSAKP